MAIYTLERKQIIQLPLAAAWDFFSNPRNLEKITPASLNFRVRTELPDRVYAGLLIRYTVSPLFGIRLDWLTEIVQVDPPHYFVDEQRIGPYRMWHHQHFFCELPGGQTEVRDLVHYAPPFGLLGPVLNALFIRPQLDRIFAYRGRVLAQMAPIR